MSYKSPARKPTCLESIDRQNQYTTIKKYDMAKYDWSSPLPVKKTTKILRDTIQIKFN